MPRMMERIAPLTPGQWSLLAQAEEELAGTDRNWIAYTDVVMREEGVVAAWCWKQAELHCPDQFEEADPTDGQIARECAVRTAYALAALAFGREMAEETPCR